MSLEPILDEKIPTSNQPIFSKTQIYEFQCPILRFDESGKQITEYKPQQFITLEFYEPT